VGEPRRLRAHAQQLVAYLALHPDGATTDDLVAALWPDADHENARNRVWRAVSEARRQLGDHVVLRSDELYLLDRGAVSIDTDEFESLLRRADESLGADRERHLERALLLVRGEPLYGSDYPWALGETRRLRATIVDRLVELGSVRLDDCRPAAALTAAEQALALDPFNEPAHRLGMNAEAALGLRQAIVDRYQHLVRELDTRFGLEPERETRLLYRHLLSQDAAPASRP
jgi:DNA-binding SARP family transcriptional activator